MTPFTSTGDWAQVRAMFVAPHLDDVALSCGGCVLAHRQAGHRPLVVTVATDAPDADRRQREDACAMALLGAEFVWLGVPDAVYRGYAHWESAPRDHDREVIASISDRLMAIWQATDRAVVYLPLGIGNHVDHRICAMTHACLRREQADVWHYEDVPYVLRTMAAETWLRTLRPVTPIHEVTPYLEQWLRSMAMAPRVVDVTDWMDARLAAIACYDSQLPMLFDHADFRTPIMAYARSLAVDPARGYAERFWTLRDGVAAVTPTDPAAP